MRLHPVGDDVFAVFAMAVVIFSTMLVYGEYEATNAGRPSVQVTAQR